MISPPTLEFVFKGWKETDKQPKEQQETICVHSDWSLLSKYVFMLYELQIQKSYFVITFQKKE